MVDNPLVALIAQSTATIAGAYSAAGLAFPDVNDAKKPVDLDVTSQPEVAQALATLIAASQHLVASVKPAPVACMEAASVMHISHCLRAAIEGHVAEALREAGDQGLHVKDIAAHTGLSPVKLTRVLRLLSSQHLFREVAPEVFANTNPSRGLDTGKDVSTFKTLPKTEWYIGTNGLSALYAHTSDEVFKSAAHLPDILSSPKTADATDATSAAFPIVYKSNKNYFEFMEEPGQEDMLARFGMAMTGTSVLQGSSRTILEGIGWGNLPKGSVCVDVGGGVGACTFVLAEKFPNLKLIVQDRADTIKQAKTWWQERMPNALENDLVMLQPHDFMTPQPVKDAAIYFLRFVLHDWPDEQAIHILRQVHSACGPTSRVVLIENILMLGCPASSVSPGSALGRERELNVDGGYPSMLSAHGGQNSYLAYGLDMTMMALFNAKERTLNDWKDLVEAAGFKIERLAGSPNGRGACPIVCKPI